MLAELSDVMSCFFICGVPKACRCNLKTFTLSQSAGMSHHTPLSGTIAHARGRSGTRPPTKIDWVVISHIIHYPSNLTARYKPPPLFSHCCQQPYFQFFNLTLTPIYQFLAQNVLQTQEESPHRHQLCRQQPRTEGLPFRCRQHGRISFLPWIHKLTQRPGHLD